MSKRPPNGIESRLHQAILSRPNKRVTLRQVEAIIPEPIARKNALNFLLGVGLLIPVDRSLSFRAVTKEEFAQSKDLSEEENAILGLIKASKDEGIWTKHLKSKTNLHKPIIERCLRSLMAKKLIKPVPSAQHTTRKIYMLEGITPSVTLTGGPWYTDNELDTQFIRHLTEACLKIIRTLSFPKQLTESTKDALYAPSNVPEYPTASHIRNSLRSARLTETELSVGDVTKLLDILILDGEIERIPILGPSMWTSDNEPTRKHLEQASKKKRKRELSDNEDSSPPKKHSHTEETEDETTLGKTPQRNSKRKGRKGTSNLPDIKNVHLPSKRKKVQKGTAADATGNDSDEPRHQGSLQPGSPFQSFDDSEGESTLYRAINPEQPQLGWLESPCNKCPAFEFCKAGGPVNPNNCSYFSDWMACDVSSQELF